MRAIVAGALLLAGAASSGQAAEAARLLHRTVDGYRLELAIEALPDIAIPYPEHSAGYEHRVTLTVREPRIGHRVQLDGATLEVVERGHPGPSYALAPVQSLDGPVYEAHVRMALTQAYRLMVRARTGPTGQALRARFDYKHGH